MVWQTMNTAPLSGDPAGPPVLLYRPPAEFGLWDTVVAARWVEKDNDGQDVSAWCWHQDAGDIFNVDAFMTAVTDQEVYEARDGFTRWQPLECPEEPA